MMQKIYNVTGFKKCRCKVVKRLTILLQENFYFFTSSGGKNLFLKEEKLANLLFE